MANVGVVCSCYNKLIFLSLLEYLLENLKKIMPQQKLFCSLSWNQDKCDMAEEIIDGLKLSLA